MDPLEALDEDRHRSPYTGYTRDHWIAAADSLLTAAWQWASPHGSRLDLPGPASGSGPRSDGLEGYARTFLAAACRVAGTGDDPHDWMGRYADGLAAGTRTPGADDAESWPVILDYFVQGQPMVESASVALGLRLTRPWLWDRLDPDVRDRAEEWLRGSLRSLPAPNNWYLFPYMVAGFLEDVGRGDAETARVRERALDLLETWYCGEGWYSDGDGPAFDHYNGWALHLYPALDDYLRGESTVYGDRLREHLHGFGLLFGEDGAPIHFGRSLTYRFAAGAGVALGALTGNTPLAPGVSRRLLSGSLRYFVQHGAIDDDGLLSLGWHGPHRPTVQHYSGPASPYWASKAFLCLLAESDHPLWTDVEQPAPAEGPDTVLGLQAPGFLIQTTGADGLVRLHNHGSHHVRPHEGEEGPDDPHYSRLAYSTRTGPTSTSNLADNHFAVVFRGTRSIRRRIEPMGVGSGDDYGWAASWHRPVFPSRPPMIPGLYVENVVVARGRYELRVHRVVGAPEETPIELTGWAVGPDEPLVSVLQPLYGWNEQDEVRAPGGTAYAPWARMPRLTATVSGTGIFTALAVLSAEPAATEVSTVIGGITAEPQAIAVRWADGTLTRIGFDPLDVTVT